jgi:hypothetical protein
MLFSLREYKELSLSFFIFPALHTQFWTAVFHLFMMEMLKVLRREGSTSMNHGIKLKMLVGQIEDWASANLGRTPTCPTTHHPPPTTHHPPPTTHHPPPTTHHPPASSQQPAASSQQPAATNQFLSHSGKEMSLSASSILEPVRQIANVLSVGSKEDLLLDVIHRSVWPDLRPELLFLILKNYQPELCVIHFYIYPKKILI